MTNISIKRFKIILVLLFTQTFLFAQTNPDPKWTAKYNDVYLKGIDLVKLVDKVHFKPHKLKTDIKTFKTVLLQFTPQDYKEITMTSWYYCCTKHEDYYEIWKMYYAKISEAIWDQNCMGLMALMYIDGMVNDGK